MVDENCVTCHNCEYDNGAVRGVIRKPNQGDIRVMVKEVE